MVVVAASWVAVICTGRPGTSFPNSGEEEFSGE